MEWIYLTREGMCSICYSGPRRQRGRNEFLPMTGLSQMVTTCKAPRPPLVKNVHFLILPVLALQIRLQSAGVLPAPATFPHGLFPVKTN